MYRWWPKNTGVNDVCGDPPTPTSSAKNAYMVGGHCGANHGGRGR